MCNNCTNTGTTIPSCCIKPGVFQNIGVTPNGCGFIVTDNYGVPIPVDLSACATGSLSVFSPSFTSGTLIGTHSDGVNPAVNVYIPDAGNTSSFTAGTVDAQGRTVYTHSDGAATPTTQNICAGLTQMVDHNGEYLALAGACPEAVIHSSLSNGVAGTHIPVGQLGVSNTGSHESNVGAITTQHKTSVQDATNSSATQTYAYARGLNSNATGFASWAGGNTANASANYAFAYGRNVAVGANWSFGHGDALNNTGLYAQTLGLGHNNTGNTSMLVGANNTNSGSQNLISGSNQNNTGNGNAISGSGNTNASNSSIIGGQNNVITNNTITSQFNFITGVSNVVEDGESVNISGQGIDVTYGRYYTSNGLDHTVTNSEFGAMFGFEQSDTDGTYNMITGKQQTLLNTIESLVAGTSHTVTNGIQVFVMGNNATITDTRQVSSVGNNMVITDGAYKQADGFDSSCTGIGQYRTMLMGNQNTQDTNQNYSVMFGGFNNSQNGVYGGTVAGQNQTVNANSNFVVGVDPQTWTQARVFGTHGLNVGINTPTPGVRVDVIGAVRATGGFIVSDETKKEDIRELDVDSAAKAVYGIDLKKYKWKDQYDDDLVQEGEKYDHYGFTAQQLKKVAKELVREDITPQVMAEEEVVQEVEIEYIEMVEKTVKRVVYSIDEEGKEVKKEVKQKTRVPVTKVKKEKQVVGYKTTDKVKTKAKKLGTYSVDTQGLLTYALAAIQQLNKRVQELESKK